MLTATRASHVFIHKCGIAKQLPFPRRNDNSTLFSHVERVAVLDLLDKSRPVRRASLLLEHEPAHDHAHSRDHDYGHDHDYDHAHSRGHNHDHDHDHDHEYEHESDCELVNNSKLELGQELCADCS